MKSLFCVLLMMVCMSVFANPKKSADWQRVTKLKITTLSTMLASRGIGEWGYSAVIEVDGNKILFDTGNRPQTVLQNAKDLGIDLSDVKDVILSHNHGDHTGGLVTLRKALMGKNPQALSKVHVGKGIFHKRVNSQNKILKVKSDMEALGAEFTLYESAHELFPGVWLTGNVARIHPEKNWSGNGRIETENGILEDTIPEDMSLVFDTDHGFILVSGCGHAGIVNTMEHINKHIHPGSITTAIGGYHLVSASDTHLAWTAKQLDRFGVEQMIGSHCTGIDALYSLRTLLKSNRSQMVVGSVGDEFELGKGIKAGFIAH